MKIFLTTLLNRRFGGLLSFFRIQSVNEKTFKNYCLLLASFINVISEVFKSFLWKIQQNRGKGSTQKWYLWCNLEGRLKTKFGPLSQFSFIKNLPDYRGLSAKMRFVGWSTLLLNVSSFSPSQRKKDLVYS